MTRRLIRGLATATLLATLAATGATAGAWAAIVADEQAPVPRAGEPVTLGFTVLQHGETPAGWVTPTVVATNTVTGHRVEAAAAPGGKDGHFTATLTPPEAGSWTWLVELPELHAEMQPATLTVLDAGVARTGGAAVGGLPIALVAALAVLAAAAAALAVRQNRRSAPSPIPSPTPTGTPTRA